MMAFRIRQGTTWRAWMGGLAVLLLTTGLGKGQSSYPTSGVGPVLPDTPAMERSRRGDGMPDATEEMRARQMKKLREEHQKQVFSDTARLVQLATALKAEADKEAKPTAGELKDVDEIAKLAKKLSERIKNQ